MGALYHKLQHTV